MKDLQELYNERARDFMRTLEKRRFDTYIVVKSELRPLECKSLSLQKRFGVKAPRFQGSLSIQGRYGRILGPLDMVRKLFSCKDMCVENMQRIVGPIMPICRYDHPFIGMQMVRCELFVRHMRKLVDEFPKRIAYPSIKFKRSDDTSITTGSGHLLQRAHGWSVL